MEGPIVEVVGVDKGLIYGESIFGDMGVAGGVIGVELLGKIPGLDDFIPNSNFLMIITWDDRYSMIVLMEITLIPPFPRWVDLWSQRLSDHVQKRI